LLTRIDSNKAQRINKLSPLTCQKLALLSPSVQLFRPLNRCWLFFLLLGRFSVSFVAHFVPAASFLTVSSLPTLSSLPLSARPSIACRPFAFPSLFSPTLPSAIRSQRPLPRFASLFHPRPYSPPCPLQSWLLCFPPALLPCLSSLLLLLLPLSSSAGTSLRNRWCSWRLQRLFGSCESATYAASSLRNKQ